MTRHPAHRPAGIAAAVLVAALATTGLTAGAVPSATAPASSIAATESTPVAITEGSLTWGVKQSWRNYAHTPELSGGVTQLADGGEFVFPVSEGSFDAASGTTSLQLDGEVHWKSHYYPDEAAGLGSAYPPVGWTGSTDIHILDVTLSDPELVISAAGSQLTAEIVSRDVATWQMIDYGRIPLADLNISGISPATADGITRWSGLPASWTSEAVAPIGYSAGQIVDPVTLEYTGPGGAPVVDEQWTTPGTFALIEQPNGLIGEDLSVSTPLFFDAADRTAWLWSEQAEDFSTSTVQAYDITTGQPIGSGLELPAAIANQITSSAFTDVASDHIYFRSTQDWLAPIDSALVWNAATQSFSIETVPGFAQGEAWSFAWDAQRATAWGIGTLWDDAAGAAISTLYRYVRADDGSFASTAFPLPAPPAGLEDGFYSFAGTTVLGDGSLLLPRSLGWVPDGVQIPDALPLHRISIVEGAAVVSDVAGTSLGTADAQFTDGYTRVLPTPDGGAYLIRPAQARSGTSAVVVTLASGDDGELIAGEPIELGEFVGEQFAVDPADGTLWVESQVGQTVAALRDGELTSRLYSNYLNQAFTAFAVGPDHTVYAGSSDGSPGGLGGSTAVGIIAFERTISPTITTTPADSTIVVSEDAAVTATFTATAGGTPEPTVKWQSRTASSETFVDVPGANVPRLDVDVTAGQSTEVDGTRYRAVFTNAAGSIATEPATLAVRVVATVPEPTVGADDTVTGAPNAAGASTSVKPAIDLATDVTGTVSVTGTGFAKSTNTSGAYVLFGYLRTAPSAGGTLGAGYDYLDVQDGQRFIAWPGAATAGSANALFADGGFTVDGLVVAATFTGASGSPVDCLDGTVRCGVLTIGAHGGRDAGLETFTPVYFAGQAHPTPAEAPEELPGESEGSASGELPESGSDPAVTSPISSDATNLASTGQGPEALVLGLAAVLLALGGSVLIVRARRRATS
jgi:hypothetical protein